MSNHRPIPPGQRPMSSTVGTKPVPAGAIPHNILEASLFNSSQQQQQATPPLSLQQQQVLKQQQQQQQRTIALQQRYQKHAALQQQLLLYQQQVFNAQQKQKQQQRMAGYPSSSQQYNAGKQHKDVPMYSYFGGWYPAYAWGLPTPLTVNTSSLSQGGRKPPQLAGRGGVSSNQIPPQPLEQKIQNMSLK